MNKIIGYFSAALVFISAMVFLGDQQTYDPNFQLTMDAVFVPALFAFTTVVVLAKMKQKKDGLAL